VAEPLKELPRSPVEAERVAPDYLRPLLGLPEEDPAGKHAELRERLAAENPGVDGVVLIDGEPE